MGLLNSLLGTRPPFAFRKLKEPLFCTRITSSGKQCGRRTTYAIVCEKEDRDIVFPMCEAHLPDWAKEILRAENTKEKATEQQTKKGKMPTKGE